MGSYLSEPIRTKASACGAGEGHKWGVSCMQGWRTHMEDAHVTISDFDNKHAGLAMFGVFDGHGGREVAHYCRLHLPAEIQAQLLKLSKTEGKPSAALLGEALTRSYNIMDERLRNSETAPELRRLKRGLSPAPSDGELVRDDSFEEEEEEEMPKPKAVTILQSSIQSDVAEARTKRSVTKDEAQKMMFKMALLKRLENQAWNLHSEVGVADKVGCTAVCILLSAGQLVCANAGDSRAILCRGGRAVELSHDHKPSDAAERERIEAVGGRVEETRAGQRVHSRVNGYLNLSRAIGDLEFKKNLHLGHEKQMISSTPDIITERLTVEDEFIVLACDGVWDVMSNQQVCDFVRSKLMHDVPLPHIIEMLLDSCISPDPKATQGLGGDNMTCIIVQRHPTV